MAFEGVVIGADFDTAKAEAKIRKLQREYDIAKKNVENKKIEIDMATANTDKIYSEIRTITEQRKQLQKEIAETAKWIAKYEQQGSYSTAQKEKEKLAAQQAELNGLKQLENKKNQILDLETFKINKQKIELEKLKNKQVEIGEQIVINGKKQNKFTQAFEKSSKSADRLGKRIKNLIASALFFSVITKAFTALRNEFGKFITETGTKTALLVAQLKSNLATIGRTLYEGAKPYIEWLLEKLAMITQLLAEAVAKALGKDIKQMQKLANSTNRVAENAERTEKATASFDNLQKVDTSSTTTSSASTTTPTTDVRTFTDDELAKTKDTLDTILDLVGKIALGLLLWKVSKSFLGDLNAISLAVGGTLIIDALDGILKDGLDWKEIAEGAIAGALVGASIGFKLGGPGGALLGAAIGVGATLLVESITSIVKEKKLTAENVTALLSSALFAPGAIIGAIKLFNKKHKSPTKDIETATTTIGETNTGTSKLTGKLKSLIKNLALGIVIIAEVAIAAGLFVAAIWGIGLLLEQVGIAWQPVIDNGNTVLIALGLGTALLLAVGLACALMGGLGGGTLAAWMGIGIAILAEMSIATDLFLAEIIVIGLLLKEVGIAWQPVLDNGETIADGIKIGTALLVGIGVVTAALGAATVATAGALPVAIALGTALLVELSEALIKFIKELAKVADSMTYDLYPPLDNLIFVLPDLSDKMKLYTKFMKKFAEYVVDYTKSSAISGLSSTVDGIVKFFTKDPIKSLASDAKKQYEQSSDLNENLNLANPQLDKSISLMQKYYELLTQLEKLTKKIDNISLSKNIFKNFKNVMGNLNNLAKNYSSPTMATFGIDAASYNTPRLATGAVLPGGSPMLAWVNDQPKGQPYVEGSIENIAAAFEKYLGGRGLGYQNITIEANGNWAQFIKFMNLEIKKESKRASIWG